MNSLLFFVGKVLILSKLAEMKKNLDFPDQIFRWFAALLIVALYFSEVISGITAYILLGLAGFMIFFASFAYCPIYSWIGYSSREEEDSNQL